MFLYHSKKNAVLAVRSCDSFETCEDTFPFKILLMHQDASCLIESASGAQWISSVDVSVRFKSQLDWNLTFCEHWNEEEFFTIFFQFCRWYLNFSVSLLDTKCWPLGWKYCLFPCITMSIQGLILYSLCFLKACWIQEHNELNADTPVGVSWEFSSAW